MRILILGRDGQVGSALARAFSGPETVLACGRQDVDLSVVGAAARMIAHFLPDVVINAAAYTAVDRAECEADLARRINAEAVAEIARTARSIGAALIHYSTDYVFAGQGSTPYREDDPVGPLNVYGASKLAGEQAVLASGARAMIFRLSWVQAPGPQSFIGKILRRAAEQDRLQVVDDQVGAPTSARLIARATQHAVAAVADGRPLASGIYHLAAAGETSWHGLARLVIDSARRQGMALRARAADVEAVRSSHFVTAAARPLNSRLSTAKLERALGLTLPPWQEGVLETLDGMIRQRAA